MSRRRDAEVLAAARQRDLAEAVASKHVLVCTGSGGVGKTTTAAALALAAAAQGRRTIVLTIDPARRLAQALGLESLGAEPRPVPGVDGLDAMMLDMKRTFDEVVERHADSAQRVREITRNRFYQQLTDSLAGTQEYMAMEKLYDLHETGAYDLLVVDTPPTRSALDFLDAPKRLTDFLEGRFLKLFLSPPMAAGRWATRAFGAGTGLFMRAASRVTGADVLSDLAMFFQSFDGMYEGFKERAQAVYRLLQRPDAGFVVVTTAEEHTLREARYFLRRLAQDGMPLAGLVVNRVTQPPVDDVDAEAFAEAAERLGEGEARRRAAAAVLAIAADDARVAHREERAVRAALRDVDPGVLVEVGQRAEDVHDIEALAWVGRRLLGAEERGD